MTARRSQGYTERAYGPPSVEDVMKTKLLRLAAAAGCVAATMIPAGAAHAVYGQPGGSGNGPSGDTGGQSTASDAAGNPGVGSSSGTLPFTGGDVAGATLVGVALAAGGTALVATTRRRRIAH